MAAVHHYRWGGFVLSPRAATDWASRITGKEFGVDDLGGILFAIQDKVRPYKVGCNLIGETLAELEYMIVTRSERLRNYKKGDSVVQFEEGEREAMAKPLLEEEGVTEYVFRTVHAGVAAS